MKLGLGTVQLGMDYGVANNTGKPNTSTALEILNTAMSGGIDCFDTAATYGSEEIIGLFTKESGLKPKLCSKFSDCASAEEELYRSLKRLGVEKLDYFLLHRTEQVFTGGFERAITVLSNTRAVEKIGVSVYTEREIQECLKYDIQVLQAPVNVIDMRLIKSGMLERIKERGIELHARSVYLQGLLLAGDERLKKAGVQVAELDRLAAGLGMDRKALAFAYVRDCEYIDRFFIGCETVSQVKENLELYKLPQLPKRIVEQLQCQFSGVPEEILNPSLWEK